MMTKQQPVEMFMPPNTLKAKVGGGGTGVDMAAVKRAEEAVGELKAEFQDWVGDDVTRLGAARDRFAEQRSKKTAGELFRASHDIKGQAATFDFPLIARVAVSLCKLLEESNSLDALPLNLIDAHVAAIRVIFRDKIRDTSNPTATALAEELEARTVETLVEQD
jgi:chemotaxis protein histidine kinase CheA